MHYAYLLRGQSSGLFKVGISKNPHGRLSQLKTGTPERISQEGLKLFVCEVEARDWERYILQKFSAHIVHGEWLSVGFEAMAKEWTGWLIQELYVSAKPQRLVLIHDVWCGEELPLYRCFKTDSLETEMLLRQYLGLWTVNRAKHLYELPRVVSLSVLRDAISVAGDEERALSGSASEEPHFMVGMA